MSQSVRLNSRARENIHSITLSHKIISSSTKADYSPVPTPININININIYRLVGRAGGLENVLQILCRKICVYQFFFVSLREILRAVQNL